MKIILLDNIEKLGSIGSEVIVKPGYARNFLFPRFKAMLATKKNLELFKTQQSILNKKIIEKRIAAESSAKIINKLQTITIPARTSIDGKLFGSIGSREIAKVLTESVGFKVFRSQVRLPNCKTLKSVGTYNIKVHIYGSIFASVNVTVLNILQFQKDSEIEH